MCHNRFQQPATKQAGPVQEMSAGQAGHNEGARAFFEQKGQSSCAAGASRLKPDEVVGTDKSPRKYINNP